MKNTTQPNVSGKDLHETLEAGSRGESFEKNFKKYSAAYQDNESSVPGIDNDYGTNEGGTVQWKGLRNLASGAPAGVGGGSQKEPKAFIPMDHLLEQGINEAFAEDAHLDASDISVSSISGVITLSGSVPVAEMRRDAENLAMGIPGADRVVNHLTMSEPTP